MKVKRLSPRQFERALLLGHGRALLHVREYGDVGIQDEIEQELLYGKSRSAEWLMNIVQATVNLKRYAQVFLSRKTEFVAFGTLGHRVKIAAHFYQLGYEQLGRFVFEAFRALASSDEYWTSQDAAPVFRVTGFAGLESVATMFGGSQRIRDWQCETILEAAKLAFGATVTSSWFEGRAKAQRNLTPFRDACLRRQASRNRPSSTSEPTSVEGIERAVEKRGRLPRYQALRALGLNATPRDAARLFELLMQCNEPWAQDIYLCPFGWCTLPHVNLKIFEMLNHSDTAFAAGEALSRVSCQSVRKFARTLLSERDQLGLKLLAASYAADDATLVFNALRELYRESDSSIIYYMKNMTERTNDVSLASCLHFLYENSSSSWFREFVIERLISWGRLPRSVAHEACWDANEGVRRICREHVFLGAKKAQVAYSAQCSELSARLSSTDESNRLFSSGKPINKKRAAL